MASYLKSVLWGRLMPEQLQIAGMLTHVILLGLWGLYPIPRVYDAHPTGVSVPPMAPRGPCLKHLPKTSPHGALMLL